MVLEKRKTTSALVKASKLALFEGFPMSSLRPAASLRTQLWLLWIFTVLVSLALAMVLVSLYRRGSAAEVEAGRQATVKACRIVQDLYAANFPVGPTNSKADKDLLAVLLKEALADVPGVEGGVWGRGVGNIAYAYPTHEGSIPKVDAPADEMPWIIAQSQRALAGTPVDDIRRGIRDSVIVAACPLKAESRGFAAWTMMRIRTTAATAYDRLSLGLGLLLAFVVVSGGWLSYALARWSRGIARLEQTLAHYPIEKLPRLEPAGQPDLDRVVDALNLFTDRLNTARRHSDELARRLAQADRLAALGRVAAGVAHEIRNPIGAMRLKAENALGQPAERQRAALETILGQIDRLDRLCESLLAASRPLTLDPKRVAVEEWLGAAIAGVRERPEAQNKRLTTACSVSEARLDPDLLRRALENLVLNALQHTPEGGVVHVAATVEDEILRFTVSDTGPGVGEDVRRHIFEPFVSARGGGTGLGLAIVREIAEAHGGTVRLVPSASGAVFEMELPWRAS
jgi:signal transduction histidine kinase